MSALDDLIVFWKTNNSTEHKSYCTGFTIEEAQEELAEIRKRINELEIANKEESDAQMKQVEDCNWIFSILFAENEQLRKYIKELEAQLEEREG